MKAIKYICVLLLVSTMYGAGCQTNKPIQSCTVSDSLLVIGISYINNYHYFEDKTLLDTALYNFDKALNLCPKKKDQIYFQKAYTYYLSGSFEESIQQLLLISESFLSPQYKSIIKNQIKAKESDNEYQKRQNYQNIIDTIVTILQSKKEEVSKIITANDPENVWSNLYGILIYQMFYYNTLLNGQEQTIKKITDMQVVTNGNHEYFSSIKSYLMQSDSSRIITIPFMD